jgi:hypothetical protein
MIIGGRKKLGKLRNGIICLDSLSFVQMLRRITRDIALYCRISSVFEPRLRHASFLSIFATGFLAVFEDHGLSFLIYCIPNATIDPSALGVSLDCTRSLSVGTKSIPFPIDGPTWPI